MYACALEPVPELHQFRDSRGGNGHDRITPQRLCHAVQKSGGLPAPSHRPLSPSSPHKEVNFPSARSVELAKDEPDRPEVVMPEHEDAIAAPGDPEEIVRAQR